MRVYILIYFQNDLPVNQMCYYVIHYKENSIIDLEG